MKRMLNAWISSAALVFAVSCVVGHAQDASNPAATDSSQQKTIQMVGARAWLSKGLDAKKAKQGDAVMAKLQDDVKIPDSVELPKNTVLIGHVDQVQPSENKGDSSIQVTFDKAQLKNGQQLAVKATIIQISPPASMMNMDQSGGSAGGAAAMPSGPSSSPSPGGTGGGAGMQSPQPSRPAPNIASGMPDPSQQTSTQQQSGVSGVILQSDIHQSDSGTFTSKGKNVHLADGTQMQMAVAVVPPNTQVK